MMQNYYVISGPNFGPARKASATPGQALEGLASPSWPSGPGPKIT